MQRMLNARHEEADRENARLRAADETELAQMRAARDKAERRNQKNAVLAKHAPYLAHDDFKEADAQDLVARWRDPEGKQARDLLSKVVMLKEEVKKVGDAARRVDEHCQDLLARICELNTSLPPSARYTPPAEAVVAANADAEDRWRTQLPPALVEHLEAAFAEADRNLASRSARQKEWEDKEIIRRFGAAYPDPFTPHHQIPDEALADLDADLETARAGYVELGMSRSRSRGPARSDGRDDLLRLCSQQTNWHKGLRGAALVAEAQAMHDSGELRRNEYPFYPLNRDWSIFNAPFHRLPAKAQRLLRKHYPEEFAPFAPAAGPSGRRSPRQEPYKRPTSTRVALGHRSTRVAPHEQHNSEIDTLGAAMSASTVRCKTEPDPRPSSAPLLPVGTARAQPQTDGWGYGYNRM